MWMSTNSWLTAAYRFQLCSPVARSNTGISAPTVSSPIGAWVTLASSSCVIFDRRPDRRCLVPRHHPELRRADGVVVLVDLGPVRVVHLVDREARVERVVETHMVDALVDRLLDQQ